MISIPPSDLGKPVAVRAGADQVSQSLLDLVRESLIRPLNATPREAADRQGWIYVTGIFASFRNHGYSAHDIWFRRAKEPEQLQGPRLWLVGYIRGELAPGALHANHTGHQVIADRLYRSQAARGISHPRDRHPTCERFSAHLRYIR